jgi:predicted AlkP superfamily pyrophosphatase or phosphodiesterase
MNPLMLPPAPKDVGRLSAVLPSALASLGLEFSNSFRLPKVKHSIVIFVDGLGHENLVNAGAHAKFLNRNLEKSIRCEFPSTTATSIAGFATGQRSGSHGLIGYTVYNRITDSPMNLLTGWKSRSEASGFKTLETLSEQVDIRFGVVGPSIYRDSGFTELTMKGASYIPAETISERFEAVGEFIKGESSFSYLYIPELDQLAHRLGVESTTWLETLEEVDSLVAKFVNSLPRDVGVILTADHGVLDVVSSNHYFLDDQPWFSSAVARTGGDPRCNFLYLTNGTDVATVKKLLRDSFGHLAYVAQPHEIAASGWALWENATPQNVVPDLILIWNAPAVGYDRRSASANSMKMVGQHGGISDRETRVPFITLGAY